MILILENNRTYSDHAIVFVDVPDAMLADVRKAIETLAALPADWAEKWSIVAEVSALEWRAAWAMRPVGDFLEELRDAIREVLEDCDDVSALEKAGIPLKDLGR